MINPKHTKYNHNGDVINAGVEPDLDRLRDIKYKERRNCKIAIRLY